MRTTFTAILLLAFLISCNKHDGIPRTEIKYMSIYSASSPLAVAEGKPIVSKVSCGFNSGYPDFRFSGFEIKEEVPKQFAIRAKVSFEDKTGFPMPSILNFDTTLSIQTKTAGRYILNFYNDDKVVQSDTVEVN